MVARIDKLTPEQEAMMPKIVEECIAIAFNTDPLDKEAVIQDVHLAYKNANLPPPKDIYFEASPMAGLIKANELAGEAKGQPPKYIHPFCGQHEISWLSFYYAFRKFELDCVENIAGLLGLTKAGWCWFYDEACIVTERQKAIHLDEAGRLHSATSKAIEYSDGWGLYMFHGVSVPEHVIMNPSSITVAEIEKETNAEVRRVMIERYGQARYLKDSGGKMICEDRFGKLHRKEIPGDEAMLMVELLNSTPEPDGTVKTYFLRVPPVVRNAKNEEVPMTTPHQAVAWTFGLDEADYNPSYET